MTRDRWKSLAEAAVADKWQHQGVAIVSRFCDARIIIPFYSKPVRSRPGSEDGQDTSSAAVSPLQLERILGRLSGESLGWMFQMQHTEAKSRISYTCVYMAAKKSKCERVSAV